MLSAKDIIEMEESLIHNPEPRKRSETMHIRDIDSMRSQLEKSGGATGDWNPALASRRASVPIEIIIGENGKPIFTATHSNVGSPNISERRKSENPLMKKEGKKAEPRSTSKKRSNSVKKKKNVVKKENRKNEEKSESPDSPLSIQNDMATCSIGSMGSTSNGRQKNIEHLPEYLIARTQLSVTVRDSITQTDLI